MSDARSHLEKLHFFVEDFKSKSGDEVIGNMLPEFAELVVALNAEVDKAQKTMVRLTWAVTALTVIMLVIGAAQLYIAMFPNQPPSTKNISCSEIPANAKHTPDNH
jgi:hypothetical protein